MTGMPDFREGVEEAEEGGSRKGFADRLGFFALDDGKSMDGRMLSDGLTGSDHYRKWITVRQHNSVPTRPAPTDLPENGKWPKSMSAVCRHDKAFATMYTDCFICDVYNHSGAQQIKGNDRTWGLFLQQEIITDGQGRPTGLRDIVDELEIEKEGVKSTVQRPRVLIVNQAWQTFWSKFSASLDMHGTVLDRAYRIKRKGTGIETDYTLAAFDPAMIEINGEKIPWDFRDERVWNHYVDLYGPDWLPDLGPIVAARADDEYYERFFDTRVPHKPRIDSGPHANGQAADAPPKPAVNEPSEADLAALAARISGQPAPTQQPEPVAVGGGMTVPEPD